MKHEFTKIKSKNETRYVLETASAGASSTAGGATLSQSLGSVRRRTKEASKPPANNTLTVRNPVARAAQRVAKGSGSHTDRKRTAKNVRGTKHKNRDTSENVKENRFKYDKTTGQMRLVPNELDQRHGLYINGRLVRAYWSREAAENVKRRDPRYKDAVIKAIDTPVEESSHEPDHEISMASNELVGIVENAKRLLKLIQRYSEMEGLEAWQQSKITKAADYLNGVLNSLRGDAVLNQEDHTGFDKGYGQSSYDTYAGGNHGRGVAEGDINEIDYADKLDSSSISIDNFIKAGNIIGNIEGNDVVMLSKGNQTIYILKVDDKATAFVGFDGKNLKNIKNFTQTPGVIRALLGYLFHKKNMKIVISPNEPLTAEGLKWIIRLINDPRGLDIKNIDGGEIDPIQLKQEWKNARKTGTPGTTGITISENRTFGNKLRENELRRNSDSLLMPFNFYSVRQNVQVVAETSDVKSTNKKKFKG